MKWFVAVLVLVALVACGKKDRSVGERIRVISKGDAITVQDYTAPDRVVVLDFTADW